MTAWDSWATLSTDDEYGGSGLCVRPIVDDGSLSTAPALASITGVPTASTAWLVTDGPSHCPGLGRCYLWLVPGADSRVSRRSHLS